MLNEREYMKTPDPQNHDPEALRAALAGAVEAASRGLARGVRQSVAQAVGSPARRRRRWPWIAGLIALAVGVGGVLAASGVGRLSSHGARARSSEVPPPTLRAGSTPFDAWPDDEAGLVGAERALSLADQAERQGDRERALHHLEQAVAVCPTHKHARYRLGLELMRRRRLDDAVRQLEASAGSDPRYAAPYDDLGLCHWHAGRAAKAWEAFNTGARRDGSLVTWCFDTYLGLRDVSAAVLTLRRRTQATPDDPIGHYRHVAALCQLEDPGPAQEALARLLVLAGDQPAVQLLAAHVADRRGKADRRIAHLARAVELDPSCAQAWWRLAEARLEKALYAEGLQAAREACRLAPHLGRPYVLAALATLASGGPEAQAIELLEQALAVRPDLLLPDYEIGGWADSALDRPGIDPVLGKALHQCLGSPQGGSYPSGGSLFRLRLVTPATLRERCRELGPARSPWAMVHYAWLLQQSDGDAPAAALAFTEALELRPNARALNNRGILAYDAGRWEDALRDYAEAGRLSPDFAWVHNNRGLVYQRQGRHREAVASFSRALYLDPNYATARTNRTTSLEALGDSEWLARERALLGY